MRPLCQEGEQGRGSGRGLLGALPQGPCRQGRMQCVFWPSQEPLQPGLQVQAGKHGECRGCYVCPPSSSGDPRTHLAVCCCCELLHGCVVYVRVCRDAFGREEAFRTRFAHPRRPHAKPRMSRTATQKKDSPFTA